MYHMYTFESKIVECIVKYKEMMTEYKNEQSTLNQDFIKKDLYSKEIKAR